MMKLMVALSVLFLAVAIGVSGEPAASPLSDSTKASSSDSDPHLVARWKFDEASGKTAGDSSGRNHPGTLEGGLSFETHSVPVRGGRALRFDGNDGCVRIAGYKGVTGTQPRTIAAWVKLTAVSGEIVSWGLNDHGKMWTFGFIRSGLGVTPHGGYLYMKPGLEDNRWHHVASVVREGSPPNLHDDVKLYRDGEPAELDDIGLLDLWPIETGAKMDVRIGWRLKGLIQDLRIYDRPLSEEEIKSMFQGTGK
jgi:hypothetical protein